MWPARAVAAAAALLACSASAIQVRLGFLGPYDPADGSPPECPACGAAFLSAVEWINANPLQALGTSNFSFEPSMSDSSTFVAALSGSDLEASDRYCQGSAQVCGGSVNPTAMNAMAVLADKTSNIVTYTAPMSQMHQKPMVGYGATADDFSNDAVYPYYSRIVSPDRLQGRALAELAVELGWEHVGMLTVDDTYGSNMAVQFTAGAEAVGLIVQAREIVKVGASVEEMSPAARSVRASGVRVVVVAARGPDAANLFRAGAAAGLTGPGYTWIGPDGVVTPQWFTDPSLVDAGLGSLVLFQPYTNPLTALAPTPSATAYDWTYRRRAWTARVATVAPAAASAFAEAVTEPLDPWALYVWDATVFTARGLARAFNACSQGQQPGPPGAPYRWDGLCVQRFIRNGTWSGATGDIALNQTGGDRLNSGYSVLNIQRSSSNVFVPVGNITDGSSSGGGGGSQFAVALQRRQIVWSDNSTNTLVVPDDGDFSEKRSTITNTAGVTAAVVLAFVAVALAGTFAYNRYLLYRERNKPENMSDLQNELLELGMGTTLSITSGQLGFNLELSEPLKDFNPSDKDAVAAVESTVLEAVRGMSGLPRRVHAAIRDGTASVRVDPEQPFVLLVMPRPPKLKPGDAESAVEAMWRHIMSRDIRIDGAHRVVDVAIVLSTRVPAEVDRRRVTRLEALGEGHYGEVCKATLSPLQRNVPDIVVAAKSLKPGEGEGTDLTMRQHLLKEAALVALFDHRNVVGVIGVVTVPRNIPPLLLLEFCENGALLEHVKGTDPTSVSVQELLTFCHDVCCGMHYLSLRRIVHRDVAARNVLLDSGLVCKVADFGMASALTAADDDYGGSYSSAYVKVQGEMSVRWAAIEVLTDNKFSRASDVWSYGVLAFEVMSRGQVPYAEYATLIEVTEHVKAGTQLACPEDCDESVYTRVMLPCWHPDPEQRPGFRALRDELQTLGVVREGSDEDDGDGSAAARRRSSARSTVSDNRVSMVEEALLQAPSVHHLRSVLLPHVVDALGNPHATVCDAVRSVLDAETAETFCPRDGDKGCAYVDTLVGADNVGRAVGLLSYTWQYRLASVVNALELWCKRAGRTPKRSYVWICSLCMNQHRMCTPASAEDLAAEFGPRVRSIGRLLPMLEPWRQPLYLTRAWCLFELYTAITVGRDMEIDIILSEEEEESFLRAMATEGYGCIDKAIGSIRSQDATASEAADLKAIREHIESLPGGFDAINDACRRYLDRWFRDRGAVRTSSRVRSNSRARSTASSGEGDSGAEIAAGSGPALPRAGSVHRPKLPRGSVHRGSKQLAWLADDDNAAAPRGSVHRRSKQGLLTDEDDTFEYEAESYM